jgi:RraA family protein
MGNTSIKTADLCDNHIEKLQVVEVEMKDYGKRTIFHGEIVTLKVFEDNTVVRTALEANGKGKVLIIDGGGSKDAHWWAEILANWQKKMAGKELWYTEQSEIAMK